MNCPKCGAEMTGTSLPPSCPRGHSWSNLDATTQITKENLEHGFAIKRFPDRQCGGCRWFVSGVRLACHRHAPIVQLWTNENGDGRSTVWPWVNETDWCGDWEMRREE